MPLNSVLTVFRGVLLHQIINHGPHTGITPILFLVECNNNYTTDLQERSKVKVEVIHPLEQPRDKNGHSTFLLREAIPHTKVSTCDKMQSC